MPLLFEKGDITKLHVDAIVNAANETLLGGGGVDGCIHRAAGPELLAECRTLHGCKTGDAKITKGYNLPAKHVIHTVGPIWHGGNYGEKENLISCYRCSLELALENHCQTVAFPLISAGAYGYPKDEARDVAIETIRDFLAEQGSYMTVYLVFFDGPAYDYSNRHNYKLRIELERLLEDKRKREADIMLSCDACVCERRILDKDADYDADDDWGKWGEEKSVKPAKPEKKKKPSLLNRFFPKEKKECIKPEADLASSTIPDEKIASELKAKALKKSILRENVELNSCCMSMESIEPMGSRITDDDSIDQDLRNFLQTKRGKGKSFSEKLLEYIEKRGISNTDCYKFANVSKQIFSNIISTENYVPKKHIVLGFAVSLKLDLDETESLLKSAGYAFSENNNLDNIVSFYIGHKMFDIYRINDMLREFNEKQLGAGY